MSHTVRVALLSAALWLVLSGYWKPWLLGWGVVSVVLVAWISHRMDVADHESQPLQFNPSRLLAYQLWLLKEIVKSNLDVTREILRPRLAISPTLARVAATQRTEIGRVTFANSITLTPGTVSLKVGRDTIEVHALLRETAQDLAQGEMDRRVSAAESRR